MTGVRREVIPFLWSTVREIALAKGFSFNRENAKYQCVCTEKSKAVWKGCIQ